MTSYQIYKFSKEIKFQEELSKDFLKDFTPRKEEGEMLMSKINRVKKNLRQANLNKKDEKKFIISYEFNMHLPDDQSIWVPEKVSLYTGDASILLASKGAGDITFVLEKYLQHKYEFFPVNFKSKKLLSFWRQIQKAFSRAGHQITLKRIILTKTFLNSSLIDELNFKSKNVEDTDGFNELVKNAREIRAITFQIDWSYKDKNNKKYNHMTCRLGNSGNLLLYGTHPDFLFQEVINTIETIIINI